MNPVKIYNRVISFDNEGNLIIQNNKGVNVKIKLSGKKLTISFDINVGDLNVKTDGLEITGKKSGKKSVVPNEILKKIFAFVDNNSLTETEVEHAGSTIKLKKILQMSENKKIIKINEKDLSNLIKKVLSEQETQRYMFFSNLEQIKRQCEMLLNQDQDMIESILDDGHDWAQDHIAEAKNNMDQVFDFLMNETKSKDKEMVEESKEITEKQKKNTPTNPSLWKKSLSWARSRYKVCPSAYCNGAAAKHYKSLGGKWKKK